MPSWPTPQDRPVVFTTSWCPFCATLRSGLAKAAVAYDEIDVEADPSARAAGEFVMSVNGGNRVVPTVLFPDGTTATNPPAKAVADRLAAAAR